MTAYGRSPPTPDTPISSASGSASSPTQVTELPGGFTVVAQDCFRAARSYPIRCRPSFCW